MGLLDNVLGSLGSGGGANGGGLMQAVEGLAQQHGLSGGAALSAVQELIQQQGGVAGLTQAFQSGGLGHLVSSWVGNGQNLPISSDQLQQVLGSGPIAALAQKFNIAPDQAGALLSKVLPQAIDHLTPNGQA